jgi:heptosyltransferase-2
LKKVLIIHTAYPGDLILSTPMFESIKSADETVHLSLLTLPQNAELFSNNPFVDDIIQYDKRATGKSVISFLRLVIEIREKGFDTALIPHPSIRSALLAVLGGISRRVGFANRWCSFLYTDSVDARSANHEVERNLALADVFTGTQSPVALKPRVFPSSEDLKVVTEILSGAAIDPEEPFIVIAPGSSWQTKAWPEEKYRRLISNLTESFPVVLVGGEEDLELCMTLEADGSESGGFPVINVAGRLSLLQSTAVISMARAIISGDSAPVHLASAVGTPVVVIYGPTVTDFGFYPYDVPYRVIQKDLPCRPCSAHGPRKCPLEHFKCMIDIYEKEVLDNVVELMHLTAEAGGGRKYDSQ